MENTNNYHDIQTSTDDAENNSTPQDGTATTTIESNSAALSSTTNVAPAESTLLTSVSVSVPVPAAAAVGSHNNHDDDSIVAIKIYLFQQLTELYGFDAIVSNIAIEEVTSSSINEKMHVNQLLEQCCTYILENQLGTDNGGPIVPIDNCPHVPSIDTSLNYLNDNNGNGTVNYYFPMLAKCTYDMQQQSTISSKGKSIQIDDTDDENDTNSGTATKNDTNTRGTCPSTENWLCLHCGAVRCSRYVNGHNVLHWEETKKQQQQQQQQPASGSLLSSNGTSHCIAISLSDLSVWCHECTSYITNPTVFDPIVTVLQKMKFPSE